MSGKLKLAVIFGGASNEHEVSLMSAASVLRNLSEERYTVYPIGITKAGRWLYCDRPVEEIENGSWEESGVPAFISPDPSVGGMVILRESGAETVKLDCIFPVLHGKNGEDGTIQGLFRLSRIPFVGCNTLSSAVCMDKAVTHTLLSSYNIEQAHYLWFYADRFDADPETIRSRVQARLRFPVFVKPANSGSSVGVSKVERIEDLDRAVYLAAAEDGKIVVEEGVDGQEVECAVLGNRDSAEASVVGEIGASAEFYDYEDKYVNGTSELFIPARIPDEAAAEVRRTAVRAFRLLGCSGLSRVDFFVTRDEHKVILNEINTLPGFTSISMYPKLWMSMGYTYAGLLDRLVELAMERGSGSERRS